MPPLPRFEKKWVYLLLAAGALLIFAFNESFRQTISRRTALRATQKEIDRITRDTANVRADLEGLRSNPQAYEALVRRELGYLRPGETEVRLMPAAASPRKED